MFSGSTASAKVFFRIRAEKVASRVTLQLDFRTSGNLAPGSKLDVTLNGGAAASIPLGANSAAQDQLTSVPVDLSTTFLATDNTLEFRTTAKCQFDCDDSAHPRIWVRIEKETTLHISGNLLLIANDLRLLNEVNYRNRSDLFHMGFAFDGPPDRTELEAAGIVASKVGVLTDFAGPQMPVSIGSIPVGDVFFIGRSDAALPESLGLGSLGGPAIALRDNPNDRFGKLVLIIGDYSEQIRVAAKAFALRTFTSDASVAVIVAEDQPPARVPYDAPRWLGANKRADFGQSLSTKKRRVTGSGIVRIISGFLRICSPPATTTFRSSSGIPAKICRWPRAPPILVLTGFTSDPDRLTMFRPTSLPYSPFRHWARTIRSHSISHSDLRHRHQRVQPTIPRR